MTKIIKKAMQYFILFCVGAVLYYLIEVVYRGYSFPSMAVLGGLSLIFVGAINDTTFTMKMPIWLQMIIGGVIITGLELVCGLTMNQDYHIWDYRGVCCNFKGQICLPFYFVWCGLSAVAIVLQDYMNYFFFDKKEKPHYYLWF